MTAFAAATIARTPPMRTGMTAWKIAKGLYLVPLLIAYTGLISWDLGTVMMTSVFAILGCYAIIAAMEGYLEGPLTWLLRLVLGMVGVALIWPDTGEVFKIISSGLFIALFWASRCFAAAEAKSNSSDNIVN